MAPAELELPGAWTPQTEGGVVAKVARARDFGQLPLMDAPQTGDRDGSRGPLMITDRTRSLLNAATAIEQVEPKQAGAIGFQARIWAQLSLPYRDPDPTGRLTDWERRNGSLTLTITPAVIREPGGQRRRGFPYGVIPRYVLAWMATEAVRTKSPTLEVGGSLSEFMRKLGMTATGGRNGSITRTTEQMRRLLGSQMLVEDEREEGNRWSIAGAHFNLADSYQLWFSRTDGDPEGPLWGSTVTLSHRFYQSVIGSPVPVDTRAMSALGGSALRLDLYTWLAHRFYGMERDTLVPWSMLAQQFGADYREQRNFVTAIMRQLPAVLAVYPAARVHASEHGLLLSPSPTPVPPTGVRRKQLR